MRKRKKTQICFSIDNDILNRLDALSEDTRRPRSSLIAEAVYTMVAAMEDMQSMREG